jgi:hypothetical protein
MAVTLDQQQARKLRNQGMAQALAHANLACPDWEDKALIHLLIYPHGMFMAEEVREWAYQQGLPQPPHERAWGGIIRNARKLGLIKKVGFQNVKNPKAHATPAGLWQSI